MLVRAGIFMANTGIRAREAKHLRWRHNFVVIIAMASTAGVLFAGLWTMGSSDETGAGCGRTIDRLGSSHAWSAQ